MHIYMQHSTEPSLTIVRYTTNSTQSVTAHNKHRTEGGNALVHAVMKLRELHGINRV